MKIMKPIYLRLSENELDDKSFGPGNSSYVMVRILGTVLRVYSKVVSWSVSFSNVITHKGLTNVASIYLVQNISSTSLNHDI